MVTLVYLRSKDVKNYVDSATRGQMIEIGTRGFIPEV